MIDLATLFGTPPGKPLFVAELSGNHNGDLQRALALVDAAKAAGADAVKLQTYTADTITLDHDGPGFLIEGGLWDGRRLYDLYQDAHTPWEWHPALFAHARAVGMQVFSAPFDETAVDFLETLDNPVYKIASFELVDLPLIRHAAATGKPMILSTGMADDAEIAAALEAARAGGCHDLMLLHCVSGYPTPAEEANLQRLPRLAEKFGVPVGLSDHTFGTAVPVAAVALGAVLVEKHFTLRRSDGGPDAAFSLEPEEFARLCADCLTAARACGPAPARPSEERSRIFRPSLYVVRDVAAGEILSAQSVRSIRPAYGLPPADLDKVLGRRASRDVARGTPLDWSMVGDAP